MDIAAVDTTVAPEDQAVIGLLQRAFLYARPEHSEAAERITLDATIEELGIDSVAALEMSGFIEEQLDVQIPDEELVAIRSMRDLARIARKYGHQ